MTRILVGKLLRDIRLPLCVVAMLLAAFQCLWAKITQRIVEELIPTVTKYMSLIALKDMLFKGPGQLMQTLMGGETIQLDRVPDMLTIGYVHPLVQTILCIWAIGRAAGAIAGEIDRGTMELLLAQPLARFRIVLAHLCIDLLTIPLLCLSLWGGTWLGTWLVGILQIGAVSKPLQQYADPLTFGPALVNVAALLFAVSGYTMWLSARGRFRGKVLGAAVLITLLQFLANVVGQMWDTLAFVRPFTVFYYYQPQQIILQDRWLVNVTLAGYTLPVYGVAVLALVGVVGYLLALWSFCRRDLPAPL